MGNSQGRVDLEFQLKRLLKEQGIAIENKTLEDFLKSIERASPWFITGGGLNVSDWEEVRRDLQYLLKQEGPDVLPISTFSLWRLVKDALLTDQVRLRQVVQATKEVLSKLQESETKNSLCSGVESDDDCNGQGSKWFLYVKFKGAMPKKDEEGAAKDLGE